MSDEVKNTIKEIPRHQRRVLGVLMEKGFTTPDQYPLTLKATTTGCNQKSNRSPVVSYSEDEVQDSLDDLRQDLLVAEVYTDGGRAARYRHYMRHKFDFSEAQFAIMAELMLRGRQQPGELRTRASRMVKIESQDQLREELAGLQEMGYLQANGPLDRRGIEVDHTFYLPAEGMDIGLAPAAAPAASDSSAVPTSQVAAGAEEVLDGLTSRLDEQHQLIERLQGTVSDLEARLQRLEMELGL